MNKIVVTQNIRQLFPSQTEQSKINSSKLLKKNKNQTEFLQNLKQESEIKFINFNIEDTSLISKELLPVRFQTKAPQFPVDSLGSLHQFLQKCHFTKNMSKYSELSNLSFKKALLDFDGVQEMLASNLKIQVKENRIKNRETNFKILKAQKLIQENEIQRKQISKNIKSRISNIEKAKDLFFPKILNSPEFKEVTANDTDHYCLCANQKYERSVLSRNLLKKYTEIWSKNNRDLSKNKRMLILEKTLNL